jgi:hypothetical protein
MSSFCLSGNFIDRGRFRAPIKSIENASKKIIQKEGNRTKKPNKFTAT